MGDERYSFGNVQGPVQTGDGVQYTAGRDQNVAGRDQVVVHGEAGREILAELASLRQALAGLRLTAAVEQAVRQPEPDTGATSRHLQSFTAGLKEAGALAVAGTALVESIAKIAHWLGPLGASVLALL
jgi:hypothetical protein